MDLGSSKLIETSNDVDSETTETVVEDEKEEKSSCVPSSIPLPLPSTIEVQKINTYYPDSTQSETIIDKKEKESSSFPDGSKVNHSTTPPQSTTNVQKINEDSKDKPIETKSSPCCICYSNEISLEYNPTLQCYKCKRTYHQLCHFVPLFSPPRSLKSWQCLICQYLNENKHITSGNLVILSKVGRSKCRMETSVYENSADFLFEKMSAKLKSKEIQASLISLKSKLSNALGLIRSNQHAVEIYRQSAARKSKQRAMKQSIPLELVISYEKLITSKKRCKKILSALKTYMVSCRPHEPRIEDELEVGCEEARCCICYSGEATDENDILLCDGEGCFRAMHMKCTTPPITQEELDKDPDGDWFCCYCTAFAQLIYHVQAGSEGEQIENEWESVDDVFPEIEFEEALANKMRRAMDMGRGVGYVWKELIEGEKVEENEEDDDEEDDDFDPDKKDIKDDDDEESYPSNLSLGDVSSVASMSDNELDELNKKTRIKENDTGKVDKENIIEHKRKRPKVDYRKLNDVLFKNVEGIDDEDEYKHGDELEEHDSNDQSSDNENSEKNEDENQQKKKRSRPHKNPDEVKSLKPTVVSTEQVQKNEIMSPETLKRSRPNPAVSSRGGHTGQKPRWDGHHQSYPVIQSNQQQREPTNNKNHISATKMLDKKVDKVKNSYLCRRCGAPKKGHVCSRQYVNEPMQQPTVVNNIQSVTAYYPNNSYIYSMPPQHPTNANNPPPLPISHPNNSYYAGQGSGHPNAMDHMNNLFVPGQIQPATIAHSNNSCARGQGSYLYSVAQRRQHAPPVNNVQNVDRYPSSNPYPIAQQQQQHPVAGSSTPITMSSTSAFSAPKTTIPQNVTTTPVAEPVTESITSEKSTAPASLQSTMDSYLKSLADLTNSTDQL